MQKSKQPSQIFGEEQQTIEDTGAQFSIQQHPKAHDQISNSIKTLQQKVNSIVNNFKIHTLEIVEKLKVEVQNTLQQSIQSITTELKHHKVQIHTIHNQYQPSLAKHIEKVSQLMPSLEPSLICKASERYTYEQNPRCETVNPILDYWKKQQETKLTQNESVKSSSDVLKYVQNLVHQKITTQEKKMQALLHVTFPSEQSLIKIQQMQKKYDSLKLDCRTHQTQLKKLKDELEKNQNQKLLQIGMLKRQYKKELQNLQNKNGMLSLELNQKAYNLTIASSKFVSNSQKTHPQAFTFIAEQIEHFAKRQLLRAELVFQSDHYHQDLSNYLKEGFPAAVIFYSEQQTIFGLYASHINIGGNEQRASRSFLFNATKQKIYVGNRSQKKDWINPVSFKDNLLIVGNRELILKNQMMRSLRVYCGCIFGVECFQVKRRQELTGSEEEQISIKKVQLHRLFLSEEQI